MSTAMHSSIVSLPSVSRPYIIRWDSGGASAVIPDGMKTLRRIFSASGPLIRMMLIPPVPGAVAIAAIVSFFMFSSVRFIRPC